VQYGFSVEDVVNLATVGVVQAAPPSPNVRT
jgi:hypothetical protein